MPNTETLFELIRCELVKVAMPGVSYESIGPDSLLIEELGVDSFSFVRLTVGLETALQIEEFPMQAWVDRCVSDEQPIDVRSLVTTCGQLLGVAC